MPFTFDELLSWAQPMVVVVDHHNKSTEEMKVLKNEWEVKSCVRMAPYHRAIKIKWLKKKQKMASDDATMEKIDVEINRLKSETLEEYTQRVKANVIAKASEAEEKDRKKEKAWNDKMECDKANAIAKAEEKERENEKAWNNKMECGKANAIAKAEEKEREKERTKEKAWNNKMERDKANAITKAEEKEREKERMWEEQYT